MEQWEYKIVIAESQKNIMDKYAEENSLKELGQQGWELVSVVPHREAWNKKNFYFKRKVQP